LGKIAKKMNTNNRQVGVKDKHGRVMETGRASQVHFGQTVHQYAVEMTGMGETEKKRRKLARDTTIEK
jgi:hypothetical protein